MFSFCLLWHSPWRFVQFKLICNLERESTWHIKSQMSDVLLLLWGDFRWKTPSASSIVPTGLYNVSRKQVVAPTSGLSKNTALSWCHLQKMFFRSHFLNLNETQRHITHKLWLCAKAKYSWLLPFPEAQSDSAQTVKLLWSFVLDVLHLQAKHGADPEGKQSETVRQEMMTNTSTQHYMFCSKLSFRTY